MDLHKSPRTAGSAATARFRRFHLGRNGAVHGGALALLFDSLLGFTAFKLSQSPRQRTAYLHVDYRKIVPVEKELQVDAGIDRIEGRKIFVSGRLLDGDDVRGRSRGPVRQARSRASHEADDRRRTGSTRPQAALGAVA